MKVFFIIVAAIAFLMGIILFVTPKTLIRTSEIFNREVGSEDIIFTKRITFGVLLIAFGTIMVYFLIWG